MRAPLLFCCVVLLQATASADPPRSDEDLRAFESALEEAVRCHERLLTKGPAEGCPEPGRLGVYKEIYEDGLALAFGANDPPRARVHEREMAETLRCQRALGRGMARYLPLALRVKPVDPEQLTGALAPIEDHCKVVTRSSSEGVVLPSVGPQCAAAVGATGDAVAANRLRRCVEQMLTSWVGRLRPERAPRRPNIVLVLTDDQRADSIGSLHAPDAKPVMRAVFDRIGGEGVVFRNAFVTNPVCGPSRASILTGRWTFRHGVLENEGPRGGAHFDDAASFASELRSAGYRTGYFGKYVNAYMDPTHLVSKAFTAPAGWDEWQAFLDDSSATQSRFAMIGNQGMKYHGRSGAAYSTDTLKGQALAFVDEAAGRTAPFLLVVATSAPHWPYEPAPRHRGALADSPAWRPANFFEADVSDKPAWVHGLPARSASLDYGAQTTRIASLEMLLAVDELVASLLERLEALGVADDTLLVFTSDNGMGWGEHRWNSKACPWEECLRVPLLVRYPRLAPLPRSEEALALNIDLASTFAELARVPAPAGRDGTSLVRAIDGTLRSPREDFLIESYSGAVRTYVGLRDRQWKYIEYASGESELYDLAADPWELENLALRPEQAQRIGSMRERIHALWPGWPGE